MNQKPGSYLPAVDGLRGIAVLSVLVYHLDESLLPGGFIGVDIFFVISGFLITRLLNAQLGSGQFALLEFYRRRVARILPALLCMIIVVLLAAGWIYEYQDYASAGITGAAAACSLINIKLFFQGSYFQMVDDAQPFLHCWSLSLEEQFYVLYPLLLWMLHRAFQNNQWRRGVLWILFVSSYVMSGIMTEVNPVGAFYLLHTRAWELLAGALLAHYAISSAPASGAFNSPLAILGLIGISVSVFMFDGEETFPGWRALLPVASTVAIIGVTGNSGGWTRSCLSWNPLVLIGTWSYSLYLWHWPIFSLVDYHLYYEPASVRISLKLFLTISATLCSFYTIERPIRSKLNAAGSRVAVVGAAVSCCMSLALFGFQIRQQHYFNTRTDNIPHGGRSVNPHHSTVDLVLMGDSHASMYGSMIAEAAHFLKLRAQIISVAAGNPVPGSEDWQNSITYLKTTQPKFVVYSVAWADKFKQETWRIDQAIKEILNHTETLIIFTQPPKMPFERTRGFLRSNGYSGPTFHEPENTPRRTINHYLKLQQSHSVQVINVDTALTGSDGKFRFSDSHHRYYYHDQTHFSHRGALLYKNVLSKILKED
jgi:peptidoglycan/LPS O-acetylase OafA/YrhL